MAVWRSPADVDGMGDKMVALARKRGLSADLIELAPAKVTQEMRVKAKKQNNSLPDGSFLIPNVSFLHKAIQSFGRCPPSKRAALKALIRRRARELGATDAIPENW